MTIYITGGENERFAVNDYIEVQGDFIASPYAPCVLCQYRWVNPEVEICNDCRYEIRSQHFNRARQTKTAILLGGLFASCYVNILLFGMFDDSGSIWKYLIYGCEVTMILTLHYLAYLHYQDEPL